MINPDELLLVVDENNNPLSPLPRKIAHKKNLWHRTTGIWVINDKKEILCQKRSLQKDVNPEKWEAFFGGHLGPDEDFTESAVRETSEELGIKVDKSQFKTYPEVVKSDKPTHREFQHVFAVVLNNEASEFTYEKEEIDELKWVSLENLRKILLEENHADWVHKPWDEDVLNWIEAL